MKTLLALVILLTINTAHSSRKPFTEVGRDKAQKWIKKSSRKTDSQNNKDVLADLQGIIEVVDMRYIREGTGRCQSGTKGYTRWRTKPDGTNDCRNTIYLCSGLGRQVDPVAAVAQTLIHEAYHLLNCGPPKRNEEQHAREWEFFVLNSVGQYPQF